LTSQPPNGGQSKAPIGVPFGNFGQDCFDLAINEEANFEHYSREIASKGIRLDV
jgi:hypothetical protein